MGKKNRHYIADWLVIIAHKSRLNFVKASGVQLYQKSRFLDLISLSRDFHSFKQKADEY